MNERKREAMGGFSVDSEQNRADHGPKESSQALSLSKLCIKNPSVGPGPRYPPVPALNSGWLSRNCWTTSRVSSFLKVQTPKTSLPPGLTRTEYSPSNL